MTGLSPKASTRQRCPLPYSPGRQPQRPPRPPCSHSWGRGSKRTKPINCQHSQAVASSLGVHTTCSVVKQAAPPASPEDEDGAVDRFCQGPRHHQLLLLGLQGRQGSAGRQHCLAECRQVQAAALRCTLAAHHFVCACQVLLPVRAPLLQDVRHIAILQQRVAVCWGGRGLHRNRERQEGGA